MKATPTYVIASSKNWNSDMADNLAKQCNARVIQIEQEPELTLDRLDKIRPDKIFFPHWSAPIDSSIHKKYECIIFHMTDLPFGRGGSPLQNLIARGIYQTKISAIRCDAGIDTGPVYLKKRLSLHGHAEEIYIRAGNVILEMMVAIVKTDPTPAPQTGESVNFKRRRPEQSDIKELESLEQIFDYIRMLDARGYPKAFLETDRLRLEFSRAALKKGSILADVQIFLK
jgi:methionyl-tRNA formyltransferase